MSGKPSVQRYDGLFGSTQAERPHLNRSEQTFLQRRDTNGQRAHEKMRDVIRH